MQLSTLPKFLDHWRSITFNRFVLHMMKDHNLQLRCHPPLFHIFRLFKIKAALTHHPIIQKVMDGLLAKGTTEPSTGGAGFNPMYLLFLSVLVAYSPYSVISDLISVCTYPLLRCLLWDRYGNLLNRTIMLSLLISRMLIYIFLLLSITIPFYY